MPGYTTTRRTPRTLPVDCHEGSRAAFVARVQAAGAAAAREGGEARAEYLRKALERIADPRTLIEAARHVVQYGGPARGADGVGPRDLGMPEVCQLARVLSGQLRSGAYRPGPVVRRDIPKPKGGTRTISVPTVADRVVERAVVMVLSPVLDPGFSPLSFGGRPGRSPAHALAAAQALAGRYRPLAAVPADVQKAFDTVPHAGLEAALRKRLGDAPVTDLLMTLVRGRGTVGIAQGGAASMLLLNVYLDEVVDRPEAGAHPGRPLIRYADDVLALEPTVGAGRDRLAELAGRVGAAGMALKDTDVVDLREGEVDWIGYRIGRGPGDELTARTAPKAWTQLEDKLKDAYRGDVPGAHARSVVKGWVAAIAPTYPHEDREGVVNAILDRVQKAGFGGEVSGDELLTWWGGAYSRYAALAHTAREEHGLGDHREGTGERAEPAAAPPATSTANVVPTDRAKPGSSTNSDAIADTPRAVEAASDDSAPAGPDHGLGVHAYRPEPGEVGPAVNDERITHGNVTGRRQAVRPLGRRVGLGPTRRTPQTGRRASHARRPVRPAAVPPRRAGCRAPPRPAPASPLGLTRPGANRPPPGRTRAGPSTAAPTRPVGPRSPAGRPHCVAGGPRPPPTGPPPSTAERSPSSSRARSRGCTPTRTTCTGGHEMPEQSGENVLSVRPKEMARRLGVSERTLWTWTKKNEIPHVKVGTGKRPVVLYPVREVESWLARRAGGDPGRPAGPTPP